MNKNLSIITNPFILEKDSHLSGNSEVWKTDYQYTPIAIQNTIHVMENKNCNYSVQVKTRQSVFDKLPAFHKIQKHYARDFELIETGCNSVARCALVVDIDYIYEPIELKELLDNIEDCPDCIVTFRASTKHCQIHFYLNENIATKYINWNKNKLGKKEPEIKNYDENLNIFRQANRKLAKKFTEYGIKGIDFHYNGGMMRNIYHKNQQTFIYKNKKFLSLADSFIPYISENTLENFISDIKITKAELKELTTPETNETSLEQSRHWMELRRGTKFIWAKLSQGYKPTRAEFLDYMLSIKFEIAKSCHKEPHSDKEIMSQIDSIYEWSIEHYNPNYNPTGIQTIATINWNKAQHQAKIKKAKELKPDFIKYKKDKLKMEDIAKKLGMSRTTLYSYLPLFMVVDTVATITRKNKTVKRNNWDYITATIDKRRKHCLKLNYKDIKNYLHTIEDSEHLVEYRFLEPDYNQLQLQKRCSYKIAA